MQMINKHYAYIIELEEYRRFSIPVFDFISVESNNLYKPGQNLKIYHLI